ncbi:MAG: hypothetical protein RJA10_2144 [Pseudomonadota bacterium]
MPATTDSTFVRTMCPMNCHPTLCGMQAEVRDGRLVGVKGDPANPDSRGFLCVRGQATREIFDNPLRLTQPLMRDTRGGDLRPASWDEAMDRIVACMASSSPEATAFWPGHGALANNYGTRFGALLLARFAHLHGSHFWNPTMVCWGLGAFGLALTGPLATHTMQDLADHAGLVLMWGANLASQPNTARHLLAAKARGAAIVTVDVRHTEAAAKSDEVLIVRPGTDTALALALMHVICAEGLHDAAFVARHTTGFEALAGHLAAYTPAWAEGVTGVPAERIAALARRYATTRPAMIVLGGSSMFKGDNGWQAARAIACLPGLTGQIGVPGAGFGPRHGSAPHGRGLASVVPPRRQPMRDPIPNQMTAITAALRAGRIHALLLPGSNMLSSFVDTHALAEGLQRTKLVVSHDLFLNETARRHADVVLPATAWLEELGCKMTSTHLYLMEPALAPEGQTRSLRQLLQGLADRLGVEAFFPWRDDEALLDEVLNHPSTGPATVASLRRQGGIAELKVSPVAHATLQFDTPSRRIEFYSQKAADLGLPPLPVPDTPAVDPYPLALAQGRTLLHFHAFYDGGQALASLARREREPQLWLSPDDAAARGVADGVAIRVFNQRGSMSARAHVTPRMAAGAVWMRDGWLELNQLTDGAAVLPDHAADAFPFAAGQSRYGARVEVEVLAP